MADPSLGVSDLMKVLRAEMAVSKSWDLWAILAHPNGRQAQFSWKTAPNPTWMAQTADLMYRFVTVAPNGILHSSKLKQAVLKLQHEKKINFSKYHEDIFADKCDYRIRCLLNQYRILKHHRDEYSRCMRKSSESEQEAIDKVLDLMEVEKEEVVAARVPNQAAPTKTNPVSSGSSDAGIFGRILAKQDSDENKGQESQLVPFQNTSSKLPVPGPCSSIAASSSGTMAFRRRKNGFGMGVFPEEDDLFFPSPVKDAKQTVKMGKQNKEKQKATNAAEGCLSDDDLENMDQALKSTAGCQIKAKKGKTAALKKPAAAQKKPSSPKKKKNKKKSDKTEKGELKCTFRHRKTSSAYNKEKAKYKRLGYSPSTCKKMARAAWLKVANEIDSGVFKEEKNSAAGGIDVD